AEVLRKESTAWSWVSCETDLVENRLAWKLQPLVFNLRERRECSVQSFGVRRLKHGVPILFGLGFETVELVVMEELEIGKDVLHLLNEDELEMHFGVGEGVVDDKGNEG
ncbi:hypothetical protein TorRG33x02_178950, partial [Trema orientale]